MPQKKIEATTALFIVLPESSQWESRFFTSFYDEVEFDDTGISFWIEIADLFFWP